MPGAWRSVSISIHPPPARRDRLVGGGQLLRIVFQSTHLLRGGTLQHSINSIAKEFQSTHLLRGGTVYLWIVIRIIKISIHPPPARRDLFTRRAESPIVFQSTHLLRGGTPLPVLFQALQVFQSTHLLRGGTIHKDVLPEIDVISIHPPPARRDILH